VSTKRLRGASGFDAYYRASFGERWPALEQALLQRPPPVARLNPHARFVRPAEAEMRQAVPVLEGCVAYVGGNPERDATGLLEFYVIDPASVLVARALEVQANERVLDLCAAPGGKTLVLADALTLGGQLVANDRSPERAQRLRRVLADYLPTELRSRIQVTSRDGRRWGIHEENAYDAVLLDAPCSSERHVLADSAELAKWSEGRVTRLAQEQYALLTSALLALKPGGRVVYSTCALAEAENDGVIDRLFEKGRHRARVERLELPRGAPTRHGWQFLPDRDDAGPMYVARLVKE
jgi:16S rRNA C967 or C1407 C5-methylase (RsmB/RsmF family)